MILLASLNAAIFFLLGVLHFYWALGGGWALDGVVPTTPNGQIVLTLSAMSCVVVGGGLWLMSFVHLANAKYVIVDATFPVIRYATLAIGVIFLIRVIGDFNWVGFFKKVQGTPFAKNDTVYYVPLCLFLAVSSFILFFRK
jgi:hypothetical protein